MANMSQANGMPASYDNWRTASDADLLEDEYSDELEESNYDDPDFTDYDQGYVRGERV